MIAVVGGLAVGWAYSELLPGLPRRPWTILAWVALIGLTLTPSIVLAQLNPPLFGGTGENVTSTISVEQAVIIFVRNLLLTATVIGGLGGWLIGRTRRAGFATALAGFVFALGPGHNVPFLGNTPATGKGIALLVGCKLNYAENYLGGLIGCDSVTHPLKQAWEMSYARSEAQPVQIEIQG